MYIRAACVAIVCYSLPHLPTSPTTNHLTNKFYSKLFLLKKLKRIAFESVQSSNPSLNKIFILKSKLFFLLPKPGAACCYLSFVKQNSNRAQKPVWYSHVSWRGRCIVTHITNTTIIRNHYYIAAKWLSSASHLPFAISLSWTVSFVRRAYLFAAIALDDTPKAIR